jgi:hypothetical protein
MKITLPLLLRQKQRVPSFSEKPFSNFEFRAFFSNLEIFFRLRGNTKSN